MKTSSNNLYYKPVDRKAKDEPVLNLIKDFLEEFPNLGVPSVTDHLKKSMIINKKKVARIMKEYNLLNKKKPKKPFKTTNSEHKFEKFENLIKGKMPDQIGQIIVGDVTAFDVKGKTYYLALLMDLCNREIIGSALSKNNNTKLVLAALEDAYVKRGNLNGCYHHTDADVRYCSDLYIKRLKELGMKISMCVGNVFENAHAESLNKTVKYGEININEYDSFDESVVSIFSYIERYNRVKPHSSLNGMSPLEYTTYLQS